MQKPIVPLVILSGPVGVGKTSVGHEMSEQLAERGIAHTFIDLDALAHTYPRREDDPYGSGLAVRNLGAVWSNCAAEGSLNLIVARVVESAEDVSSIESAVPGAKALVVQLRAGEAALRARVGKREIGSGHDWHVSRAIELARSLLMAPCDRAVETDGRRVTDIAAEIVESVRWRGRE